MTIHAFCRRLLATHPLAAGLDPAFRVLDASRGRAAPRPRLSRDARRACSPRATPRSPSAAAAYEPWRLAAMTRAAHERLRSQGMSEPRLPEVGDPVHSPKAGDEARDLTPAEVAAAIAARAALERLLEGLHARYEGLKDERSALDFADLELRALELLRSSPALAAPWRERFDHLMVDEFQDTNRVQLELVEQLRGPTTQVFMVGDEHQSIYRFRNADLEVFRAERDAAPSGIPTATCCRCAATSARARPCSRPSTPSAERCSTTSPRSTAGRGARRRAGRRRAPADAATRAGRRRRASWDGGRDRPRPAARAPRRRG